MITANQAIKMSDKNDDKLKPTSRDWKKFEAEEKKRIKKEQATKRKATNELFGKCETDIRQAAKGGYHNVDVFYDKEYKYNNEIPSAVIKKLHKSGFNAFLNSDTSWQGVDDWDTDGHRITISW